jgi:acetylglutamate kinase
LSAPEVRRLIAEEVIYGGMIPKVTAALDALGSGVRAVMITDLDGLCSGSGTRIVA